MTVLDLITEADQMTGVQAVGEVLEADESAYGLSKLNQMIDMWATERLAIYRTSRATFVLVANQQTRTIGASGQFVAQRPVWIDGAGLLLTTVTPNVELGIEILTRAEYQQIPVKTQTSTFPLQLWYDPTFPNGTLYFYPVPTVANSLVLYAPQAVAEFTALTDVISLPPGYRMALVSNLAILMALGIRDIPAEVQALADKSFGNLKAANVVTAMDALACDPALRPQRGGTFNWFTGNLD